jgi:AraC-like DNA-binding protein
MNHFVLKKDCRELHAFPHIMEYGFRKITTIQFDSLKREQSDYLRLYYVFDGRHEWMIADQREVFFPGDLAIVLPGQTFGGEKSLFDIGTIAWIHLEMQGHENGRSLSVGKWSRLTETEVRTIARILRLNNCQVLSKIKEAGTLFQSLNEEFLHQEICYSARVNHLLDDLLITIIRQLNRQRESRRDFPLAFAELDQTLRKNLSYQWTVEEMATLVGLGITAFSEKLKQFSGFSPLNYLINIRISEAIKLLKRQDKSIADLAYDIGFYSSQHFATTFKKLTGYAPREFRKKHAGIS